MRAGLKSGDDGRDDSELELMEETDDEDEDRRRRMLVC